MLGRAQGQNDSTVMTTVQLDPGSAEFLQPTIGNLTNITMQYSTLAVCPCKCCLDTVPVNACLCFVAQRACGAAVRCVRLCMRLQAITVVS